MGSRLFRPLRLLTFGFLATLMLALLVGGALAWRSARKIEEVHEHVGRLIDLQEIALGIERMARESLSQSDMAPESRRAALRRELLRIQNLPHRRAAGTSERLQSVEALLEEEPFTSAALFSSLQALGEVAQQETQAQQRLLEAARDDNRSEQRLIVLVPLVLLALFAAFALVVRWRIIRPLRDLESVVHRLADGHFDPVAAERVDPLLQPLFGNYNRLVRRLGHLEDEHRSRAASLEEEVRAATRALLEQQRSVARGERLAAAGMMAASMAHELRNPLAGVDLALRNLRGEIEAGDAADRIDLVAEEVRRVQGLLNGLLDSTRALPERSRPQDLGATIKSLLALVRYQVAEGIALVQDCPEDLRCDLPANRLRQALLNLVLNAAQALDRGPGTIMVSAHREDHAVRIRVSDDGPGFSREMIERGVRPFLTSRKGGTGLGLPMVKRFVDDLGGTMEIANRNSGGACVTMSFPGGDSDA